MQCENVEAAMEVNTKQISEFQIMIIKQGIGVGGGGDVGAKPSEPNEDRDWGAMLKHREVGS